MVRYCQVVVGPPGCGKSTYCNGVQQYMTNVLKRPCKIINFDPANELLPYDESECLYNICEDAINVNVVMEELKLGPNGGLLYAMEYMEHHFDSIMDEIEERLKDLESSQEDIGQPYYLLFDFPGQVEVYTHCTCVQKMLSRLADELDYRICAVQLIDAHNCSDSNKFISSVLLATTMMLRLEVPAVNILSKIDLVEQFGTLPFNLEYFTDCVDLNQLLDFLDQPFELNEKQEMDLTEDPEYQEARSRVKKTKFFQKHRKIHETLAEVIDDFSLVSFLPLDIQSVESVGRVIQRIDKTNGYVFGLSDRNTAEGDVNSMFQYAIEAEVLGSQHLLDVQERFMKSSFADGIDELKNEASETEAERGQ